MNRNTPMRWALVSAIVLFGCLFALPNLYHQDPAVQVTLDSGDPADDALAARVESALKNGGQVPISVTLEDGRIIVRTDSDQAQLDSAELLKRELVGGDHVVALSRATRTPGWMLSLGAKPVSLGLDLRGGVHFLIEVDVDSAKHSSIERYMDELPATLRAEKFRYRRPELKGDVIQIRMRDSQTAAAAQEKLSRQYTELQLTVSEGDDELLLVQLTEEEAKRIVDFAVTQNLATLRSRVNQLGVAEPVVQRQGRDRIVVQLPGVQDPASVKDSILGATATLEYRAVAEDEDAERADRTGIAPVGTQLFYRRDSGAPILLKRKTIATGSDIVNAQSTVDQDTGGPAVSVTLSGKASRDMFKFTEKNVGKLMAVLYKKSEILTSYDEDGNPVRDKKVTEDVISAATVQGVFGKRFQTTGLTSLEARDLASQLRLGALAAPIGIIEERTVGPSLGHDNIEQGRFATIFGFILVVIFMAVYYRVFGLIADVALILNLVLIMAVLSLLQATLTLPGIAGILLTVGMAVDANVLIFQRIREELKAGARPQDAITAGYDKAFVTIADANFTTLIAAIVLFIFGTGPVKGFAVTLSIGIITSMFTAIYGTRVVVNAIYGGKPRLQSISI